MSLKDDLAKMLCGQGVEIPCAHHRHQADVVESLVGDKVQDLLEKYYDPDWQTFSEDGWRFVRDIKVLLGMKGEDDD